MRPPTGEYKMKRASFNVALTVALATFWGLLLWAAQGPTVASQFFSGYLMEWVLSVDNLVAISMVFAYFKLPKEYEPRILTMGLFSVVFTRLFFTWAGAGLLAAWGRPVEVIFGVLVACTAVKMIISNGDDNVKMVDHDGRWYIKSLRWWFPVTGDISQPVFLKRSEPSTPPEFRRVYATPLLACLIAIEITDLMFSLDSVPTVIAVSRTPLVIYSAMLFAIFGLRQMYFLLQEAQRYLTRLPQAVSGVLLFVSAKMMLSGLLGIQIPAYLTLAIVVVILGLGVRASLQEIRHAELQQKRS